MLVALGADDLVLEDLGVDDRVDEARGVDDPGLDERAVLLRDSLGVELFTLLLLSAFGELLLLALKLFPSELKCCPFVLSMAVVDGLPLLLSAYWPLSLAAASW